MLILGGICALLKGLQPQIQLHQSTIFISKNGHRDFDLEGNGLLLMPCVFVGSQLSFDPGSLGLPVIDYGPRGLATVWEANGISASSADPLTALIGRGRAAILHSTELPRSVGLLSKRLGRLSNDSDGRTC